jgi:hypothetical protein
MISHVQLIATMEHTSYKDERIRVSGQSSVPSGTPETSLDIWRLLSEILVMRMKVYKARRRVGNGSDRNEASMDLNSAKVVPHIVL